MRRAAGEWSQLHSPCESRIGIGCAPARPRSLTRARCIGVSRPSQRSRTGGQSGPSALVSLGAPIANSDCREHIAVDSVNDAAQRPTEMT